MNFEEFRASLLSVTLNFGHLSFASELMVDLPLGNHSRGVLLSFIPVHARITRAYSHTLQDKKPKIFLKTKDSDVEKNLKWLPLSMRRDMHTINLTFKCLKGSPPMFFKDYFNPQHEGKWAELAAPQSQD